MSAKIKYSYEEDEEKEQLMKLLDPLLEGAKIKQIKKGSSRYRTIYINLHCDSGGLKVE